MYHKSTASLALAALVLALTLAGCGKAEPEPKWRTVEGKALSINLQTGEVAMEAWLPGQKQYRKIAGMVNEQTEVLINGRPAKLADVRPGDNVKVTGYTKGEGLNVTWMATHINVIREDVFAPAADASTKPAGGE